MAHRTKATQMAQDTSGLGIIVQDILSRTVVISKDEPETTEFLQLCAAGSSTSELLKVRLKTIASLVDLFADRC